MLHQILLGSCLIVATAIVHGFCTGGVMWLLKRSAERDWGKGSLTMRSTFVAMVVLLLCYATLMESAIWARFYVFVGAIDTLEKALYFSTVTFTTLGYGDVTLASDWRLLGALQAANGIIIFGWTTAIVVALLQHVISRKTSNS